MTKHLHILFVVLCMFLCSVVNARDFYVKPQWYTGSSDFREAMIDKTGCLVDAYNKAHCDTVNVFDINVQGEYAMNISFSIKNMHNNPFTNYAQYTYNEKGDVKRAGSVSRPVYGWVWGMKDMLHYNAVWMRASRNDDVLYGNNEVEFCVVTINGTDTTYHVNWRSCFYQNSAQSTDAYAMWIQYSNNTAWIGGGWSHDIPWATVHNIPSFGGLTGLYLGTAAKVRVENVITIVKEKDVPRRTEWTTASLNKYFNSGKKLMPCEGFWHVIPNSIYGSNKALLGGNYELAIVANGDSYDIIYLSGAEIYPGKWKEGTIKATLNKSNNKYLMGSWYDAEGERLDNVYLSFDYYRKLRVEFADLQLMFTMLPTQPAINQDAIIDDAFHTSHGTGFALTSDGYLVTNHHVVEGGIEYYVCFDPSLGIKPYRAEVVVADSIHDLAIMRINDPDFTTLGEIPYGFTDKDIRVGEDIFYLGYPMTTIVGDDIKFSNGNVTAINGFNRYDFMMSVDIDHGSSGSPIFDADGNAVGIAYSGFEDESLRLTANCAIKTPFLYRLIEQLPSPITLPVNKIKELSQPDKIEAITPFIFSIKTIYP